MKATFLSNVGLVVALLVSIGAASGQTNMSTAFTYQGQLEDGGSLVTDTCEFEFSLWDDAGSGSPPAGGTQLGSPVGLSTTVEDGLFTVQLDFGEQFTGQARWLQMAVCCPAGSCSLETLSPRQELTPAPHALALPGMYTQQNTVTEAPNVIGGYADNEVTVGVVGATISGGGASSAENRITDYYGTVGGGRDNQAGDAEGDTTDASYATVGGGYNNDATGIGATIGGGRFHTSSGNGTTVTGGLTNTAGPNEGATVGGGYRNTASGNGATISGGKDNEASGGGATIGGGTANTASGSSFATVSGGHENTASGYSATVPGGLSNTAAGSYSFAAGRRAQANHQGSFVWADSDDNDFASTSDNTFIIRASGGVGIGKNDPSEQLDVQGNIHASGTITSGSSITIDGTTDTITATSGTIDFNDERLVTSGLIESTMSGFKFPDGTIQTTAATTGAVSWSLAGNAGTTAGTDFVGTTDDEPLELHVNSARALRIEPHATSPNLIGGYSGNNVTAAVHGATIAGGGGNASLNRVTDDYGTIGGGKNNQVGDNDGDATSAPYAVVCGGIDNEATGSLAVVVGGNHNTAGSTLSAVLSGGYNNASGGSAVIGGGQENVASGSEAVVAGGFQNTAGGWTGAIGGGDNNTTSHDYATVSGGRSNTASGEKSAVGGGNGNIASGALAAVPGGTSNVAAGSYSFAAGQRAKANHNGAFVWGDSTNADVASERIDQFRARANGGARFDINNGDWIEFFYKLKYAIPASYSVIDTSTDAYLSSTGVWTNSSDKAKKENFTLVSGKEVVERLANMSISTWNFKEEDPRVRHLGPTAQDFYAAFGLGGDDQHIGTLDAEGVALAAIQGLHEIVKEKDTKIERNRSAVCNARQGREMLK